MSQFFILKVVVGCKKTCDTEENKTFHSQDKSTNTLNQLSAGSLFCQCVNVFGWSSHLSCLNSCAALSNSWMFLVTCSVFRMTSSVQGSVGSGSPTSPASSTSARLSSSLLRPMLCPHPHTPTQWHLPSLTVRKLIKQPTFKDFKWAKNWNRVHSPNGSVICLSVVVVTVSATTMLL